VPNVLVYENADFKPHGETPLEAGREEAWHTAIPQQPATAAVEWVDAEHPLFLLYTSGSTGKPKGVLHTTGEPAALRRCADGRTSCCGRPCCALPTAQAAPPPTPSPCCALCRPTAGGYMVYAATTTKYTFAMQPGDVFWCTADCGWITGHSYLTYGELEGEQEGRNPGWGHSRRRRRPVRRQGDPPTPTANPRSPLELLTLPPAGPLMNRATSVVFEGVPTYPDPGRCWEVVDKYAVKTFYTAPTAIRSLMRSGDTWVKAHGRQSLQILGTVGEPINPEAWRWYHEVRPRQAGSARSRRQAGCRAACAAMSPGLWRPCERRRPT
jgi:acetyl-CoA synthetase